MRNQKQNCIPPFSLSNFHECDEQTFQEYLQTYCQMVEKKQKEDLNKQMKINFFMEEQQQNIQSHQNIFNTNLSFPSINLFDYKEIQQFTGVGSLKHIDIKQKFSFQYLKQENGSNKCKIQHNKKYCQNDVMDEEYKDDQGREGSKILKYEGSHYIRDIDRQVRLKQIIRSVDMIKDQLENTLNCFMKTVSP